MFEQAYGVLQLVDLRRAVVAEKGTTRRSQRNITASDNCGQVMLAAYSCWLIT